MSKRLTKEQEEKFRQMFDEWFQENFINNQTYSHLPKKAQLAIANDKWLELAKLVKNNHV